MEQELILIRPSRTDRAYLAVCRWPEDPEQRTVSFLHPEERSEYESFRYERRQRSYWIGRRAAKLAAAGLTGVHELDRILIRKGVFGQPLLTVPGHANIAVSITHTGDVGAAVAFPEGHPIGLDLERVDGKAPDVLQDQLTERERRLAAELDVPHETAMTMLWAAKESLSKVIKTGLTTPLPVLEIARMVHKGDYVVCFFENFTQYRALCLQRGQHVLALTLPRHTELEIGKGGLWGR